jgi:hypothetical protein
VTTPGETLPDLIGNYAVMRLADRLLWEKVTKLDPQSGEYKKLWKQRIDIISRCANMRLYITERMLYEDVDTVEANGLVAMLKPVDYTASGWLVEITQNGEKI